MDNLANVFGLSEKALQVFSKRADVLANNMANANTPNYHAQDLNFKDALEIASQSNPKTIGIERPNFIPIQSDPYESVLVTEKGRVPRMDGNTVDTDVERTKFLENAMHYQANLTFINGTIQRLATAIKGE